MEEIKLSFADDMILYVRKPLKVHMRAHTHTTHTNAPKQQQKTKSANCRIQDQHNDLRN